jgi:hypothetical protein
VRHASVVPADEALRERLSELANAAGVPVPPLHEDSRDGTLPRVEGHADEERIIVPPALFDAPATHQTWHLATCLGWWRSPEPRRRRIQRLTADLAAALVYVVGGLPLVVHQFDVPKVLGLAVLAVLHALLLATRAALSRREQRALDAAGSDVLRAAGHDPGALAWLVLGSEPDPPWFRRPFRTVPVPSTRISAARTRPVEPHRPMF